MFPLRLAPETIATLDAWVAELNADPERMGRVYRSDLLERIITDAAKAREASK